MSPFGSPRYCGTLQQEKDLNSGTPHNLKNVSIKCVARNCAGEALRKALHEAWQLAVRAEERSQEVLIEAREGFGVQGFRVQGFRI